MAEILKQVVRQIILQILTKCFLVFLKITQLPAAAASFASIMFAPQGTAILQAIFPFVSCYGKEDPWCDACLKGLFKQVKDSRLPEAPYYAQLSHCPHDERFLRYVAHRAVNYLLRERGLTKTGIPMVSVALPLHEECRSCRELALPWDLEFVREGSRKISYCPVRWIQVFYLE
ncbi:hypothetical protein NC653_022264 [Populus alba x Populus x berolinensis]|uniref:Uncharacterized protein n=1 Tax=Populus alba x Populus x berolinensis TaxID=444605 RepID=A0AAD6Q9H9_9ROSI|nr:hypothetical protein NC653_022264 [Populus alba x Populus x berolinensis]